MCSRLSRGGLLRWAAAGILAIGMVGAPDAQQPDAAASPDAPISSSEAPFRTFVSTYCVSCHNSKLKTGGLALDAINAAALDDHWDTWEKVVRKLRAHQMPPPGARRPDETARMTALTTLETSLDRLAAATPNPGRTDTFRRLNRTEYQNAIRDLLALDFDAAAVLPPDEASHGFDNVTVGDLSPTLLERYITAAEKISRLAVGRPGLSPGGVTVRIRPDLTQEEHVEGLPIGTRGGALMAYTFRADGDYEITIRLARDRNEHVEGLFEPHELEVLLDGAELRSFVVEPTPTADHQSADSHLKIRVAVTAGPHTLGVTFPPKPSLLVETDRQPYQAHFNMHRHPRMQPAVYQVSITGPYNATGSGDTPSRRRIFICRPARGRGRRVRQADSLRARPARVPPSGRRRGSGEADGALSRGKDRGRLRRRHRDGAQRGAVEPRVPVPHRARPGRRRARGRRTASAISSSPRACRSSSGAASRTTSCWRWPSAAS